MKTRLFTAFILASAGLAPMLSSANPAASGSDVRVITTALRNTNGQVICSLFDSADAFDKQIAIQNVKVPTVAPETTCVFHDVKPGTYMVTVIHDENSNNKLDKNFFGIPKEGYGVSNNHTYAMSSPKYAESTFTVSGDAETVLNVSLRYP